MKIFNKLAISLTLFFFTLSAYAQDSLTVISWGGAYTKSQVEAYQKPFTAKTGVTFKNIDIGGKAPAGLRSQMQAGKVVWDLVDVIEGPSAALCDEGLVEEIDYDGILAKGVDGSMPTDDFVGGLNGCFIPTITYATLFAYNTESFKGKKAPQTIRDIFNLKDFPGRRGLEKRAATNLEWALIADGVAIKDVYKMLATEAGVNRAFKKLDTIKDSVVWWDAGAQPPQLLADGEVSIASSYNGRIFNAQVVEKQPFVIIWDGQAVELDGWVVPKGKLTPKVKEFLKFSTDSQRLADQAKWISYGPARKSSGPLVSTHAETGVDMAPHMPTAAANFKNPLVLNAEFWATYGESLNERFNAWIAK